MTIPLATRGYICFGRGGGEGVAGIVFGEGPTIVGREDLAPEVDGAAAIDDVAPPSIVGSSVEGPSIVGAAEQPAPDPGAPSIVQASDLTPTIDSGGEE